MIAFFGASFLGILMVLICLLFLCCWVYGIVLSLRASIILTIICFFLHVPFVIFGLLKWAFGVDLPAEIVAALSSRGGR